MYTYYNNNPKVNPGASDCVIRAIATFLDSDWDTVYLMLLVEGYAIKYMPNDNITWTKFLEKLGYRRRTIPDTCPSCYTIADFAEEHQNGVYLVCTGGHVTCIIDGVIHDKWDPSDETCLYYFERK